MLIALASSFETDLRFSISNVIRANHGIVFSPLPRKVLVGASDYNLVFSIVKPSMVRYPHCSDPQNTDRIKGFCSALEANELLRYEALVSSINEAAEGISLILGSKIKLESPGPDKRAIFSFVGQLAQSLFGVSTDKSVKELADVIKIVQEDVTNQGETIDHTLELLHSMLNASAASIADIQEGVELNFDMISSMAKYQNATKAVIVRNAKSIEVLGQQVNDLAKFIDHVLNRKLSLFDRLQQYAILSENFLHGITALNRGLLSPHLVPPPILKSALDKVDKSITRKYPLHRMVHNDLAQYYLGNHVVQFAHLDNHIIIHVNVPFALEASIFDLYGVSSFEVPLKPHETNSTGYTTLPELADYIAISPDKVRYIEYSAAQFALCKGKLAVCPTVPVIRRRPHNTCTSGIFFENSSEFVKDCKPKVFPHREISDRIISRDPHNFLVTTSASHYRMSCRNMGLSLYPCTSYMSIKVPCGCTLYVGSLHVTPSVTDCSDNNAEVELSYPINYAIYLSFEYSPKEYPSVKISNTPIQLDVPDISAYVKNFSDINDHMAHSGLELNTVAQAVQQTRTTYQQQRQQFTKF